MYSYVQPSLHHLIFESCLLKSSYPPLTYTRHVLNKPILGSCVAQGFTGCCTSSCAVSSNVSTCYCDQLCYNFGDCCSDIEETGCFPPGLTTTALSTVTLTPISSSIAVSTPGHGMCVLFIHVTKSTYNKGASTYATCTHQECTAIWFCKLQHLALLIPDESLL